MINRKRGRPVGTHIRDEKPLAMVADRIAAYPELKPSTAMRQVYAAGAWKGSEKTVVTRWLRKWPDHAEAMLAAARDRAQMAKMPSRDITPSTPLPAGITWPHMAFTPSADLMRSVRMATEGLRHFEKHLPAMEAMARLAKNAKTIRQAYPLVPPYNPALAASLAAMKGPQVPDSVIEHFREISNSPTVIAMRELMKKRS
jgi:hypothetical protein